MREPYIDDLLRAEYPPPGRAEEFFARKGFDGAALEDIADAAGYTMGAVYVHFGSKEELFWRSLNAIGSASSTTSPTSSRHSTGSAISTATSSPSDGET